MLPQVAGRMTDNEQLAAGFGSSTRGRWWVKMRLGSEVEVKVEAEAGGVRKRRPPADSALLGWCFGGNG